MDHLLEQLYQQHRDAEAMLRRLRDADSLLRSSGPGVTGLLGELGLIRDGLQAEIDSHFCEEEWALFPVLGRHIGVESGPIAAMMEDHAYFRGLQLELETALAALEAREEDSWSERLSSAAAGFLERLPEHIQKEEGVLFPMAEDMLRDQEWEQARGLWKRSLELASRP